ncbi:MAG TPA: M20 family metallopeptidase [Thermomicrobiales bacterium]|nr:M20 family metallopeptidase [Thermomicrobiales bacterium]
MTAGNVAVGDDPGLVEAEHAFALTADLVRIRSYPGEEAAVQAYVADWFRSNGLAPDVEIVAPDRPNVLVRVENGPGPVFLLNGHVDTVLADPGWAHDPWQGRRDGDRFYGLGACDMKSGVAAAMLATRALARNRDRWSGTVLFTSVVDEEAYSIGANALIDSGIKADYCVVTEASWELPCLGSFGKYLVRVDVTGRGAHASWPERGTNAAVEAAKLVARLDEMQLPRHARIRPSQCVLSLLSGSPQYVITVPDRATILINRHTIPGETEESVLAEYQALIDGLDSPATFTLSIDPPRYPSWETPESHPLVQAFAAAYTDEAGHEPNFGYTGYGDPNLFSTVAGIPTVMFGPLGGNYHEANEWVDISSIAGTARVLERLVQDMLPPHV